MIVIHVNGSAQSVGNDQRVDTLVASMTEASTGVAVAVNEVVIPKSQWNSTTLLDGDRVEVLTAAPGG